MLLIRPCLPSVLHRRSSTRDQRNCTWSFETRRHSNWRNQSADGYDIKGSPIREKCVLGHLRPVPRASSLNPAWKFQLKLGSSVEEDIARIRACRAVLPPEAILVGDANTGWLPHEAIRVANGVHNLDAYIEQPCISYEECLNVRRKIEQPFVLDEVIDGTQSILRAVGDQA